MTLLAGDVGGTKTILELTEQREVLRRAVFPSGRFPSLTAMVRGFLDGTGARPAHACFGIAGPVADDVCRATNLPWIIEARQLERELAIQKVRLVNDFTALSIGIGELSPNEFETLHAAPADPRGPWAVIGAGTGLGEAVVILGADGQKQVLASEGGHTDFGPRNELEIDLLRFLLRRHERVSYERIVSGMGLPVLYEFLRERRLTPESPKVADELAATPDGQPAIITSHGLAGDDPLCLEVLNLFASLYGAEAGNLALKVVPRGGVFVAGGIAPKILPKLKDGTFMKAFLAKGRLTPVLETIPVQVVLNAEAGLLGAAAIAARL